MLDAIWKRMKSKTYRLGLPGIMLAIPHGGGMISEHNESVDAEALATLVISVTIFALREATKIPLAEK